MVENATFSMGNRASNTYDSILASEFLFFNLGPNNNIITRANNRFVKYIMKISTSMVFCGQNVL